MNDSEAWNIQHIPPIPNAWIQWKGTNVCMGIHCVCGHGGHVDASFCYFVRCSACDRLYFVNGHIQLIEIDSISGKVDKSCILESDPEKRASREIEAWLQEHLNDNDTT